MNKLKKTSYNSKEFFLDEIRLNKEVVSVQSIAIFVFFCYYQEDAYISLL